MEEKVKKPKGKVRKIIEWIGTIILGAFIAFAATCNIAKLLTRNEYKQGNAFGYSSYIVLTDSMEPTYKVNTAIIAYKEEPAKIVEQWNQIKDLNLEFTDERNINITFFDAYSTHVSSGFSQYTSQTEPTRAVMTHQLFNIVVKDGVEEGQGKYLFFVHGINISEHQSGIGQYQVFTEKEFLGVVKLNSVVIGGISWFLSSVGGLIVCLLIPCLYMVISSILDIYKATKGDDEEVAAEGAGPDGNNINNISDKDYEKLKEQMIQEMLGGKGDKK